MFFFVRSRIMFSALLLLTGHFISTSLQAQTAELVGNVGAQTSGNTAVLTAEQVSYTCPNGYTGNSGTLRLELWATTSPYSGGGISGYQTAVYQLGQLNCNTYFYNISSGTISFSAPPSNATYYTMLLTEFSNGAYLIVDYATLNDDNGNLVDVTCANNVVTLKFWDDQDQDGDIVTVTLGGETLATNFNMNQCGGPSEPSSGSCVFTRNLPANSAIPFRVTAQNTGSFAPNTAQLKVIGGCTPESQSWGLDAGQSAQITINTGSGGSTGYALTVSKSGSGSGTVTSSNVSGINCGSTCSANYASGTSVTLSASPASGSTFGGWSGSCSGTGTCTVSMTQARSVTASFNTTTSNYALTVSKSGSGSGTVTSSNVSGINCGSTCSANYASGTSVTLSASPASGSTFGGWSGSCSGTGTCTVSMTQARSVTANFQVPGALEVTSAFSGLWYYPEQDGHGFSISVHSATRATVFWYTYDPFGAPIWILGEGHITGNRIESIAYFFQGMEFGTWESSDRQDFDWGSFEIEFHSCNSATLTYDSTLVYQSGEEFGSGTLPLVRLASTLGLECQ